MVTLEFSVKGHEGKKVWGNLVLSRKAAPRTMQFFHCIHKHPESIRSLADFACVEVWAKIVLGKEYNGEKRNEILCYLDLPIPGQKDVYDDGEDSGYVEPELEF